MEAFLNKQANSKSTSTFTNTLCLLKYMANRLIFRMQPSVIILKKLKYRTFYSILPTKSCLDSLHCHSWSKLSRTCSAASQSQATLPLAVGIPITQTFFPHIPLSIGFSMPWTPLHPHPYSPTSRIHFLPLHHKLVSKRIL